VQFEFLSKLTRRFAPEPEETVEVAGQRLSVECVRKPRARRYVLRLSPTGAARVTVPRGGSIAEAHRFVARSRTWLERALQRQASRPTVCAEWAVGTTILLHGEAVPIEAVSGAKPTIRFGAELLSVPATTGNLRPMIEQHLRRLASVDLPPRVMELAAQHQVAVSHVSVRNQKSRWGSCSRRGAISLNWRLIQTPPHVRDYIILHELMHRREMNHSARFWREVEKVCPDFELAERWLKQNASLLTWLQDA
jgi:predicted metal-dependent hydrolase